MVQQSVKQTTLLVVISLWAAMLVVSSAVPLESADDTDEDIKRSMLWSRLLGATDRLNLLPSMLDERQLSKLANARPVIEQKRYRPAMQSRSGGMSLCLWKVCPAAPWLVTKRESSNY